MNESNGKYKVVAFRAVDEPELSKDYVNGHVKVLQDFGIDNVTSNNDTWTKNPNIYCIGLLNNQDQLYGGIRIQIADGKDALPVETAIGYLDSNIFEKVCYYATNGGIGELSGLWVNNKLHGLGMGPILVRAAIASADQLNFKTMIGICAQYSLRMFNNVGFVIDHGLGDRGRFNYPNESYIAHVVGILNAITLESTAAYDKEIIQSLRRVKHQNRTENDKGKEISIEYDITYPNVVPCKFESSKRDIKTLV